MIKQRHSLPAAAKPRRHWHRSVSAALVCSALVLSACSSDDDDATSAPEDEPGTPTIPDTPDTPVPDAGGFAFVSGNTATFDAGQIERIAIAGESVSADGSYPATLSDIRVRTDGSDVYQVGRFQIDSITRFSPDELTTPIYQYSVNGEETAANPHDIVFLNDTKAYVVRYGSPLVWIVNPQAATEEEFKIGEIDLSVYDEDAPNATDALIVDGKLYVLMQRLTGFAPDKPAYVAVIDTETDTEIDTGQGQDGLPGIELATTNSTGLQYVDTLEDIFVTSQGNAFENDTVPGDPYQGGIETIDISSYEADLLLDDGSREDSPGFFVDSLVVSEDRGYVLTYQSFGVTTLYAFNPTTGVREDAVTADLEEQDLSVLENGPDGNVWIGLRGTQPGLIRLDPQTGLRQGELIATQFNPTSLVFISPDDE